MKLGDAGMVVTAEAARHLICWRPAPATQQQPLVLAAQ
jgi:hypothetical protein